MSEKVVVTNKKANFLYQIVEVLEAGVVLQGTEVKSLRMGRANLKDSYATIRNGEVVLCNMHISPYKQGNVFNHDPDRDRKLLLHKQEIKRLTGKIMERGMTLVPLKIYFKEGRAKIELGLGRGKSVVDRRKDIPADQNLFRQIRSGGPVAEREIQDARPPRRHPGAGREIF